MPRRLQWIFYAILLGALGIVPFIALSLGEPYYLDLFTRVTIFAIAAVSLDLILGQAGILSFGHAVYLGIGGYSVAILDYYGINNGPLQFATAIIASALVALLIGITSLRTSGVYMIMITLAFGQMFYFLAVSMQSFGGDDGATINTHSNFGSFPDFSNPVTLFYCCYACLLLVLALGKLLIGARFGMALHGIKSNEPRMVAIGYPVFRYKLTAFVIAGIVCGLAGALLANQGMFVSPAIMHWTRSGEIMMMVILGGVGSLIGPVLGAVIYLLLEDSLSSISEHWQLALGVIVLLVVIFARRGLLGLLDARAPQSRHV